MPFDPTSIETELRRLRPAGLDESLLARLEECSEGIWTEPTPDELKCEQHLREMPPASLPPALLASLEEAALDIPFPTQSTIVSFPNRDSAHQPRHRTAWWASAAAVALLGAATALLIPIERTANNLAEAPPAATPEVIVPAPPNDKLTPAGFHRGLSEASDQGVIWQDDNRPHRVLKFVYRDRLTLKDDAGRTYQADQPRVEYILVPEKTD